MRPAKYLISTLCILSSLTTLSTTALAQDDTATPLEHIHGKHTKVSPLLFIYRDALLHHNAHQNLFGHFPALNEEVALISLRFSSKLTDRDVQELANFGVLLLSVSESGEPIATGNVYRAQIPWHALENLISLKTLILAEPLYLPDLTQPTENTSKIIGAYQANILPDLGVTGKGITIADIDDGFDILHPSFFRPDGEVFDWIDQDQDRTYASNGSNFVDYNHDGQLEAHEALVVLDAITYNQSGVVFNNDSELDTSKDWLYLDLNQNGVRDSGYPSFNEQDPAYGEPIFVVDDVNKNNQLDPLEKLIQLKTSKFKSITKGNTTWTRGVDLIQVTRPSTLAQVSHGTSVAGILVGGQPPYHERHGLAPDAEIVGLPFDDSGTSNWLVDDNSQLKSIETAVEHNANIILHEWTNPFTRPHDGSTNLEAAMDAAHAQGISQVNPLGNLNIAKKHIEKEITPEQPATLSFRVGNGYQYGNQRYPYSGLYSGIQWTGTQDLTFTFTSPLGQDYTYSTSSGNQANAFVGSSAIQIGYQATTRGNSIIYVFIYNQDRNVSLQQGTWKISVTGASSPSTITARISDYYTSWGEGVGWTEPVRNHGTLCFPATADSAIGVAAFGGLHHQPWDESSDPGELRNYSGRGPRQDGAPAVDITAPDDPFAPVGFTSEQISQGYTRNYYTTFGGTSGAGPHVAASLALLLEQDPSRTPDELLNLIKTNANRVFNLSNPPKEIEWGAGKLNIYKALYQADAPTENREPTAQLEALFSWSAESPLPLVTLDASESSDPDQDPVQARFDFDHDGTFDTPWQDTLQANIAEELITADAQNYTSRVEVRDSVGATHGTIITFALPEKPIIAEDMGGESSDMGSSDMGMTDEDMGHHTDEDMDNTTADMDTTMEPDAPADGPNPEDTPPANLQDEGCSTTSSSPINGTSILLLLLGFLGIRRKRQK